MLTLYSFSYSSTNILFQHGPIAGLLHTSAEANPVHFWMSQFLQIFGSPHYWFLPLQQCKAGEEGSTIGYHKIFILIKFEDKNIVLQKTKFGVTFSSKDALVLNQTNIIFKAKYFLIPLSLLSLLNGFPHQEKSTI